MVGEDTADVLIRVAVGVGRRHPIDILAQLHARAERRRHLGDRTGDAVIGELRDDETGPARMGPGDAEGEVIGLAAGAGEHDVPELCREIAQQPLGIVQDRFVQIARMGIELAGLVGERRHDMGVAMPDRSDVVVDVEIGAAFRIVEPDAFAADHMHRIGIEQPIGRAEQAPAPVHHRALARSERVGGGRVIGVDHRHSCHSTRQAWRR